MIDAVGGMSGMMRQIAPNGHRPGPKHLFKNADGNSDGLLDKMEIQSFLDGISEKTGHQVDSEKFLAKVDTNQDGFIDKQEFKAGKEVIRTHGPGWRPGMKGQKPGDFSELLMDILNQETEDDAALSNELLGSQNDSLLENYKKNLGQYFMQGDSQQNSMQRINPISFLA